jgi:hypothetical protein
MAWYLSEVVTDLSPLGEILGLYEETGPFPEDVYREEYQNRLAKLLRKATVNTDHIDGDTIPEAYEHDEYKWLAAGYHDLAATLGMTRHRVNEENDEVWIELTETGSSFVRRPFIGMEIIKERLPAWRNDAGIQPYPVILKLLSDLKRRNLYPCGGLMLLEVLIVLRELNQRFGDINIEEQVYKRRAAFYAHMSGELQVDLIDYSGFLWEELSEDLSNYHAANYPARATLQLMMQLGDLTYGPVPDELFGMVQYVTIAK